MSLCKKPFPDDETRAEAAEGEWGGHQEDGDEEDCSAQGHPPTQQVRTPSYTAVRSTKILKKPVG